jgi:hypothetical protein
VSTAAEIIRTVALGKIPREPDHVTGWFGYFTTPWVVVMARLPSRFHWWNATNEERRMFLLFVAESMESSESAPTATKD